jgi:hypothetical protein
MNMQGSSVPKRGAQGEPARDHKGLCAAAKRPLTPKALEQLRYRLFVQLEKLAKKDPALKPLEQTAKTLWLAAHDARRAHGLKVATKADGDVILWEVFFPRTTTPSQCSVFDLPRRVTRSPRRVLDANRFFSIKGEWQLAIQEDPWKDLDRVWHENPFELSAFQAYAREVDQLLARDAKKRNYRVTDDLGHVREVRCESEGEARRRFEERMGGYVVNVEEAA